MEGLMQRHLDPKGAAGDGARELPGGEPGSWWWPRMLVRGPDSQWARLSVGNRRGIKN